MQTTVEAIYENGVLKPLTYAKLKEHKKYKVILEETENSSDDVMFTNPHPVLGNITFNENPELPLDPEDWPNQV